MTPQESAAAFSALPLTERMADVCRGCGQHIEFDMEKRLWRIKLGDAFTCAGCGMEKRCSGE